MGLISLKTLCLLEHDLSSGGPGLDALGRLEQHPALEGVHLDARCHKAGENCAAMLKIPHLVTLSCYHLQYWHPGYQVSSRAKGVSFAEI